jgi:hypothetical protein
MDIKVWVVIGTLYYEGGAELIGVFTDEALANQARDDAALADKWVLYTVNERTLNEVERETV